MFETMFVQRVQFSACSAPPREMLLQFAALFESSAQLPVEVAPSAVSVKFFS